MYESNHGYKNKVFTVRGAKKDTMGMRYRQGNTFNSNKSMIFNGGNHPIDGE